MFAIDSERVDCSPFKPKEVILRKMLKGLSLKPLTLTREQNADAKQACHNLISYLDNVL